MELFDQYMNAKEAIGKYFDTDIWYNIVFNLEEKWTDYSEDHGSIEWDYSEDEFQYGIEIYGTSRWEKDDFVLVVGDDGCGNRDMYIFRKSNKVEEQ